MHFYHNVSCQNCIVVAYECLPRTDEVLRGIGESLKGRTARNSHDWNSLVYVILLFLYASTYRLGLKTTCYLLAK